MPSVCTNAHIAVIWGAEWLVTIVLGKEKTPGVQMRPVDVKYKCGVDAAILPAISQGLSSSNLGMLFKSSSFRI